MDAAVVVGEDALTCALAARLVHDLQPAWRLDAVVDKRGVSHLWADLGRLLQVAARGTRVVCLADTDGACAAGLLARHVPMGPPAGFALRLAVSEAESWVMADQAGLAAALGVARNKLPAQPDAHDDPKRLLLTLARRSTLAHIRRELVSASDPSKQGAGYNLHLCAFVRQGWNWQTACACSPSLARAVQRIQRMGC